MQALSRHLKSKVLSALEAMPAVAILGPRQVGKTTLALEIAQSLQNKEAAYLDLELESDRAKLNNAEAYLERFEGKLLIIDEVQLQPELFTLLRSLIDKRKRSGENNAQFLLLGSASRDLLQQSSQSLAGRIRYLELRPFSLTEIKTYNDSLQSSDKISQDQLWFRGGFPQSLLAASDDESWHWRSDFIESYVERDIPQLSLNTSAQRMRRFWTMLSHLHGTHINLSSFGKSLEVSHTTIKRYLDVLTDLYMVRQLPPWSGNTKKRIVKSPKIYIRDTGLLHRLLSISDFEDLLGHPIIGLSWEGFVIETILGFLDSKWSASYYRSASQTEIDLVLEKSHKDIWAIEVKRTRSPKIAPGFLRACESIKATKKIILYSGNDRYDSSSDTEVMGLQDFLAMIEKHS